MGKSLKDNATEYANLGFRILPLRPHGKVPILKDWTNKASSDIATVSKWWEENPDANIGCLTGVNVGFFVLDVDAHDADGHASLREMEEYYDELPSTVEQLTGGGGRQLFFKYPQDASIKNKTGVSSIAPGVEIKGDGGQVVLPPSIHPSGKEYEWEISSHPSDVSMAEAPKWLLKLIYDGATEKTGTARPEKFQRLPGDGPAQMVIDNCAFIRACRDYAAELSEPQWVAMISNVARCSDGPAMCHELSRPYPGYSEQETNNKIYHALNNLHPQTCEYIQNTLGFNQCTDCGVKAPVSWALARRKREPVTDEADDVPAPQKRRYVNLDTETLTDLGNANRFARMFRGDLKYCFSLNKWMCWNGMRWEMDESGRVMAFAKKCIRTMYSDAGEIDNKMQRKLLLQHANKCESASKLRAMIDLAQHMLPVLVDELDTNIWLFNCPNGIIDLKTGELIQHDPKQLLTKMSPVNYDPNAKCPLFIKFLHDIFPDPEGINIIPFMQRLIGYSLTGETKEQKMAIAWGSGANGKGTLLNLIQAIMGDYAQTTPTDTLMARRNEGIPNDIARLRGSRYVLASESQEGKRLNEALVKQMTGQDRLAARFLRCEFFEFLPQFKIILLTNHKPITRGDDAALWRRILLIPFTQKFEGDRVDGDLPKKLAAEMPGILRWMVEGCLEWQRVGLKAPPEVIAATNAYRSENDAIENWLEENCYIGNNVSQKTTDLYHDFLNWAGENGEKVFLTQKKFTMHLQQKGYELGRNTKMRKIIGLALLDTKHVENTDGNWLDRVSKVEDEQPF